MSRQSPLLIAAIAACFIILAGCQPQQPFYFHEDPELSHYKGVATEIEYPDVDSCTLGDVQGAIRPFSLQNNQPKAVWDLKLEDAIRNALTNNKIMRTIGGQIQGPPEFHYSAWEAVPRFTIRPLPRAIPAAAWKRPCRPSTRSSASARFGTRPTPRRLPFFPILERSSFQLPKTMQDTNSFPGPIAKDKCHRAEHFHYAISPLQQTRFHI